MRGGCVFDRRIIAVKPIETKRLRRKERGLRHEARPDSTMPPGGVEQEWVAQVDGACFTGRQHLRPFG